MTRCMGCMNEYDDGLTICPYCGYVRGTPAREAYHLPPETILCGRYLVGKVLGFGGFGVTYIAWDLVLEQKVAIKEYMPSDFATRVPGDLQVSVYDGEPAEQFDAGLKSFMDESKRLAKFCHEDGIVHILDSFLENNTAFIVMEYLEGQTLKELLVQRGGKIPYQEAISYLLPVIKSLDAVHKQGIIHRDIAPDNIFLINSGKVKLIDFGAARYATTLHSKSLSVILKSGYAPEEQYRSHGNQGPWSDIYAVCATLYRAITGIVPEDALERCVDDTLVAPSKLGIALPPGIENAILNGLNTKIENRIQTADELAQALSGEVALQRVKEKKIKEDTGKWSKKQIAIAVLAAVVLVAVIVLSVVGVFAGRNSLDTSVYATVPDYIGMTLSQAQADWSDYCDAQGIENVDLGVLDGVPADETSGYEVNQIYSITPAAGSWFKKVAEEKKYIYVTIVLPSVQDLINENLGKNSWTMQNLENYSREDAQKILESMQGVQFSFETIASEKSAGTVVRTDPPAGAQIDPGDTIIVYISDGTQIRTVEKIDVSLESINTTIANRTHSTTVYKGQTSNAASHVEKYTLELHSEQGVISMSGAGEYAPGTTVTVKATVNDDYDFWGWMWTWGSLEPLTESMVYTFKMPAEDVLLVARTSKIIHKGKCGDNLNWILNRNGVFKVTGTGAMYDYAGELDENNPLNNYGGIIDQIILSDGITHIGDYAFSLQNISSIDIPNSVKSIGKGAFYESNITNITIPKGVTTISDHTFEYCAKLKTVRLPHSVVEIGREAFAYCSALQELQLPNKLSKIGILAFYNCTGLSSLSLPNTVCEIGGAAFSKCTRLIEIEIPYNTTTIERIAFSGWTSSQTIYIVGRKQAPESWDLAWAEGCEAVIVWNA